MRVGVGRASMQALVDGLPAGQQGAERRVLHAARSVLRACERAAAGLTSSAPAACCPKARDAAAARTSETVALPSASTTTVPWLPPKLNSSCIAARGGRRRAAVLQGAARELRWRLERGLAIRSGRGDARR